MKIVLSVLSALLLTVALSQVAEAKKKIPVTETKTATEKNRPLLDQTATGGIAPGGGATTQQGNPGQAYPPALWIHF
ncbi:MAG: hypothetical protein J0H31_03030 [Alphaproteobacteria bacterium]|nr:hypothetical protein [Alphaproteobacteria bacterium]